MGVFRWDAAKNEKLLQERGVSFEEVALAIDQGRLLDVVGNPNRRKYGDQRMFVVEIRRYAYAVPFVDRGGEVFLKTIFPSRKLTRRYLLREEEG